MTASGRETTHLVRTYFKVFAALMALTVITVAASYLKLAVPLAIAVAVGIAALKGSLVASFFMHLIHERPLVFGALLLTAFLFAALMVLPLLITRDTIATPYTWGTGNTPATLQMER